MESAYLLARAGRTDGRASYLEVGWEDSAYVRSWTSLVKAMATGIRETGKKKERRGEKEEARENLGGITFWVYHIIYVLDEARTKNRD